MKKTIYITGLIIINILFLGCLFKINHWPGAGIMITLSLLGLIFWFIPAALINNYRNREVRDKKWLYIVAFITFFIMFLSALFKIQHWPGAGILLTISVPLPFLLFLPVYIYHNNRDKNASPAQFTAIILGLTFLAVYNGLLAINVSRDVLASGLSLVSANEHVTEYYDAVNDELKADISMLNNEVAMEAEKVTALSDEICHLIRKAEGQLLQYTGNQHLLSNIDNFKSYNDPLYNLDNAAAQYLLHWQDSAVTDMIGKKVMEFEYYLTSLNLDKSLSNTIDEMLIMEDIEHEGEQISWEEREFSSNYMVYALEALSRWEKNVRFIENAVLAAMLSEN